MQRSKQVSKFGCLVISNHHRVVVCGARSVYLVVMKTDTYPVVRLISLFDSYACTNVTHAMYCRVLAFSPFSEEVLQTHSLCILNSHNCGDRLHFWVQYKVHP